MQQTVDAVAETKDQMIVDVDSEIILVSGSSYFFYVVADVVLIAVDSDVAMTAAYGLSSCYSAVVASEATEVAMVAVADATTVATRIDTVLKKASAQVVEALHISKV